MDESLDTFIDSYLHYRRRWYDNEATRKQTAGVIVGDGDLSRRVFMLLYRMWAHFFKALLPIFRCMNVTDFWPQYKPAGHLIKIQEDHLSKVYLPKNTLVRVFCSIDIIERHHMLKHNYRGFSSSSFSECYGCCIVEVCWSCGGDLRCSSFEGLEAPGPTKTFRYLCCIRPR